MATGTPKITAMMAMTTVPNICASAPKWYGLWMVEKPEVVKYFHPMARKAGKPR